MLHYFLVYTTQKGKPFESGWMLAESADEVLSWYRPLGCGIDITYLGVADMTSKFPRILH